MTDIATLGIAVKSDQAVKAARDLDALKGASNRAEMSQEELAVSAGRVSTAMQLESAAVKANNTALQVNASASSALAFRKKNLSFQLIDVGTSIASQMPLYMIAIQQGGQIAQLYGPGSGGVQAAFRDAAGMLGGFVRSLGPVGALAAAAAAGVGLLTVSVNESTGKTYSFGQVAKATFSVFGDLIYSYVNPAVESIGAKVSSVMDAIGPYVKNGVNLTVGLWVGGAKAVGTAFWTVVDVVELVGKSAYNAFMGSVELMVNGTARAINTLIDKFNELSGSNIGKLPGTIGIFTPFDTSGELSRVKNVGANIRKSFMDGLGYDYVGQLVSRVGSKLKAGDAASAASGKSSDAVKASKAIADNGGAAANAWSYAGDVFDATAERIASAMQFARDVTGGFVQDFTSGLRNGESVWKSFSSAAVNALNKITDKLLNSALDGLFSAGSHPVYGGGGFLSNILGGLFGGFRASGGPVSAGKAYVVGERGPEMIVPRSAGTVVSNDNLRGQAPRVTFQVNNYSKAEVQERPDGSGFDIIDAVSNVIANGGADRAMRNRFNVTPGRIVRS